MPTSIGQLLSVVAMHKYKTFLHGSRTILVVKICFIKNSCNSSFTLQEEVEHESRVQF